MNSLALAARRAPWQARGFGAGVLGVALGGMLGGAYLAGLEPAAAPESQPLAVKVEIAPQVAVAVQQARRDAGALAGVPKPLPAVAVRKARDLDCLTQAVYFEARGESSAGQAAVAQVVLNRVRHPAFPKTVCGVVYQGANGRGCQFSFACDGRAEAHTETAAWNRARRVAAQALAGVVMADVGSATHFHTVAVDPGWGSGLRRVGQVGLHVFYRFGRPSDTPRATFTRLARNPMEAAPAPLRIAAALAPAAAQAAQSAQSGHSAPAEAIRPVAPAKPALQTADAAQDAAEPVAATVSDSKAPAAS